MKKIKVLATICARANSKGLLRKNFLELNGFPLIKHTLDCAKKCKLIDEIAISTDSPEIIKIAQDLGFDTHGYVRPDVLAEDNTPKIDTIKHVVEFYEEKNNFFADIIVDLDIGVPLRNSNDIEEAILKLNNDDKMDTLVTVYESDRNPYFNMIEKKSNGYHSLVKQPEPVVHRRQDAPEVYNVTPAIFAWKRNKLNIKHLYEGNWGVHVMPIERSIDIDSKFEYDLIKFLINNEK